MTRIDTKSKKQCMRIKYFIDQMKVESIETTHAITRQIDTIECLSWLGLGLVLEQNLVNLKQNTSVTTSKLYMIRIW